MAAGSYVVQYRYRVRGHDKYLLYFWQGRDSSITEKGAAAVETINVADTLGDAVQLRIEQGKETAHFIGLFRRRHGFVVHLGKTDRHLAEAPYRLYQLRLAENGEVRCIESDNCGTAGCAVQPTKTRRDGLV